MALSRRDAGSGPRPCLDAGRRPGSGRGRVAGPSGHRRNDRDRGLKKEQVAATWKKTFAGHLLGGRVPAQPSGPLFLPARWESAGTARPRRSRRASTTSAPVCLVRVMGVVKAMPRPTRRVGLGTCATRPSYGSRTTDSYISELWLVPTALPQLRTTRFGPKADSPKVSPGQSLTLPN